MKKKEDGSVLVEFVVRKDGFLSDVNVIKSASSDLDDEVERVIK